MVKIPKKSAPFPTHEEILGFIADTPGRVGKREIARAFSLDTEQKMNLKKVLKELKGNGQIQRTHSQHFAKSGSLPPVAVVIIIGPDEEGEIQAKPTTWDGKTEPPAIFMLPERRGPLRYLRDRGFLPLPVKQLARGDMQIHALLGFEVSC